MVQVATFGAGCFWCVEACFNKLAGVLSVNSGFSGGHVVDPSYKEVCEETTGHVEVIQIAYDDEQISFEDLLSVFWSIHDPTQLDRQGNDIGKRYRSVIFYHDDIQKELSEAYKTQLDSSGTFPKPIVTAIEPYSNFYPAEDYHINYFELNGDNPYCEFVVRPKVEKFTKKFSDKLK